MTSEIAIYDPRRLSEADFLAGFVARLDHYDYLMRQLRGVAENDVATHRLIVGQRGMGKTTLLRRIAIGVEAEPALRERFAALTFREEQYDVRSLAQLWRNCCEALAEWLEAHGRKAEADKIDARLAHERPADPDEAWRQFADLCEAVKRRPLLFLDNVNLVLSPLSESDGWKLRRILQARGGPVVYGASAAFLEQSVNPKAPFYEFFQVHTLEPLNVPDMRSCLAGLAQRRGDSGKRVTDILARSPERVPVLHTLTGGNPRTLAFIYRLLESERGGGVQRDLEALLDDVTGLYKARVEELAEQPRAIFDAIALNWDPALTALLTEITTLEATTLSPQLSRLVERGFVERTERDDGKSAWQVGERFFNIWYLMRHGNRRTKQKLRWLTSFLVNFYSREELARAGQEMAAREAASPDDAGYLMAMSEAVDDPPLKRALLRRASTSLLGLARAEMDKIASMDDLDPDSLTHEADCKSVRTARPWTEAQADSFFNALRQSGRERPEQREVIGRMAAMPQLEVDALLATLREESEKLWKGEFPPEVAEAVERAIDRGDLSGPRDIASAEVAAALAKDPVERDKILLWASLLRLDSALPPQRAEALMAAYRSCIAPRSARAEWRIGLLMHLSLGRPGEAQAAYRDSISLNPKDSMVRVSLGTLLQFNFDRDDEAETAYREAIEIDPSNTIAWNNIGLLQIRVARFDEAEAAYRESIRSDSKNAHPWHNLGNLLQDRFHRYEEAEAAYRNAIEIDESYASAWNGLGNLMQFRLARYDEAEMAYRKAIQLDAASALPWNGLGDLMQFHLGRYDESEEAYREALRLYPVFAPPWNGLGTLLQTRFHRYQESEAAYRKALEIDPAFAYAWNGLGNLLQHHLERFHEAEAAYRVSMRLQPSSPYAYHGLGDLLHYRLARYGEAADAYREAIRIDPNFSQAWNGLAELRHYRLDQYEEAAVAYRKAIQIDPSNVRARNGLGDLLQTRLGAYADAKEVYLEALSVDPGNGRLWYSLGSLFADHFGEFSEARSAYDKAAQCGQARLALGNLVWLELSLRESQAALDLRRRMALQFSEELPEAKVFFQLIDSGLALLAGDSVASLTRLGEVLSREGGVPPDYLDDLLRLLRLFAKHGAGERLLAWLDETGLGDMIAPVRAAFDAYLHGERKLRNVNAETRGAATSIYAWLTSNKSGKPGALWPGPGVSELDRPKAPRKARKKKGG